MYMIYMVSSQKYNKANTRTHLPYIWTRKMRSSNALNAEYIRKSLDGIAGSNRHWALGKEDRESRPWHSR